MTQKFQKFLPELIKEATHKNFTEYVDSNKAARINEKLISEENIVKLHSSSLKKFQRFNIKSVVETLANPKKDRQELVKEYLKKDPVLGHSMGVTIGEDGSLFFCTILESYYKAKGKIYVINPEFFKVFVKTKLDKVQYKHVPKNLSGFVHLPFTINDGVHNLDSFFFYCGPKKNLVNRYLQIAHHDAEPYPYSDHCVAIAYTDVDELSMNYTFRMFPIDENMVVKDSFRNTKFRRAETPFNEKTVVQEDGYTGHNSVFFNILLYLNMGQPDLRNFRNTINFRGNSTTKVVNADKNLSRKDLVLVGFGFKKKFMSHTDSWNRSAHMGWRRCGKGSEDLTWTYISGSTPKRRTYHVRTINQEGEL